jgi:hypothetical protein
VIEKIDDSTLLYEVSKKQTIIIINEPPDRPLRLDWGAGDELHSICDMGVWSRWPIDWPRDSEAYTRSEPVPTDPAGRSER